jgi:hypothetical protein
MKRQRRNLSFVISMLIIIALLTACGGKSTSAQEPADQQKPTQEASNQADQQETTEPATQETTEPADQQETTEPATQEKPDPNQEVATSDVKHWKVEDGKLMGQTGAEESVCFASFPESSGINDNAVVEDSDGECLLIKQEAAFYSYDLKTNEIKLITDGAIDSYYDPYEESVYFYNTDHSEFLISNWSDAGSNPVATGKSIENYYKYSENSPVEFDEFAEIQDLAKNGDTKAIFDKGIVIDEKGDLYDFHNNKICNVHLPTAMVGNVFATKDAACLIDGSTVQVYRYGESIFEAELDEGHWICITIITDPVVNGLFFNFDNNEIWKIDSSGYKIPISESVEVSDFVAYGDMLFYVDKEGAGYTNGWNIAPANMKVTDNCLGVSRYTDYKGFIMPEEAGIKHNGLDIFLF